MHKEKDKWIERNGRQYLKDILPLDMPFSIQIETTKACNFKCIYCTHSKKDFVNGESPLSLDLFKNFIATSKKFPRKYKSLTFCGGGEPLLNKNLFEMIKLAKGVAEEVSILTNGALLTPEVIEKLINTQIDIIRISIQGLDAKDYKATCGIKIDFEKFLSNLKFLFDNKKQTKIYHKIPDITIDTEKRKKICNDLYRNICDELIIQTISPLVEDLNYSKIKNDFTKSLYGKDEAKVIVCPQIFFAMMITQEGKVAPCSDSYYNDNFPEIGDLNKNDIYEIWNSKALNDLRIAHLKGNRFHLKTCQNCQHINPLNNEFDNIDEKRLTIIKNYKDIK